MYDHLKVKIYYEWFKEKGNFYGQDIDMYGKDTR